MKTMVNPRSEITPVAAVISSAAVMPCYLLFKWISNLSGLLAVKHVDRQIDNFKCLPALLEDAAVERGADPHRFDARQFA
jgi:hypothetical protein